MRTALMIAALIGLVAGPAFAAVPTYDPTKIYATEEAFTSSIKVYKDAFAANPKDADAAYWLGFAYWTASILSRNGAVPYGADYLDRAIDSLERAVSIDDKYMAAWQVLALAYFTRHAAPGASDDPAPSDDDKGLAARLKVIELSRDPAAANRGLPSPGARGGEVGIRYQPLPDPTVRFRPADYLVVADPDTKLLYGFSCAPLSSIKRPMLFLTKWEAISRGFTPATVCPPPP